MNETQFKAFEKQLANVGTCDSFKKDKLKDWLKENCLGKTECSLANYFDTYIANQDCKKKNYNLVIQSKCGNLADVIEKRNWSGMFCTCLGVLGNLLFIVGISFESNR